MKKSGSKLYYTIPVLYLSIILLFIYLQFSSREKIHKEIGNINVFIEKSRNTRIHSGSLKNTVISYKNYEFIFSNKSPLRIKTETHEYILYPRGFEFLENGFSLYFTNGLSLKFSEPNTLKEDFTLKVDAESFIKSINKPIRQNIILSIPYHEISGEIKLFKTIPVVLLRNDTTFSFLSLPEGSTFDREQKVIRLKYEENIKNNAPIKNTIAIKTFSNDKKLNPYLYWFYTNLEMPNRTSFTRQINSYIEKAYKGWTKLRLNSSKNGWVIPDKTVIFDERIVASVLSVSMNREEYKNISNEMLKMIRKEIIRKPEKNIPFITSVFYGGLKKYLKVLNLRDTMQISEITEKIKTLDKSVFRIDNLVTMILDRGPFSLLEELAKFAESINYSNEDLGTNIDLLSFYTELSDKLNNKSIYYTKIKEIIDNKILPSAVPYKGKILLKDKNREDIYNTFKAGILILKFLSLPRTRIKDKDEYLSIGRKLVTSSLAYADEKGIIPVHAPLDKDNSYIVPEKLYHLLADLVNNYYPEEKSLYKYLEPGSWVWTVSQITNILIQNKAYSFSFKYSKGQTQFILIQGIKPFKQIIMHGILWKSDPAYYRYSDGWFYDNSTKTLFIKITQRNTTEEIKIAY